MPVLARTPKHIYPALAIVRGAHSQESWAGRKWLDVAAVNQSARLRCSWSPCNAQADSSGAGSMRAKPSSSRSDLLICRPGPGPSVRPWPSTQAGECVGRFTADRGSARRVAVTAAVRPLRPELRAV